MSKFAMSKFATVEQMCEAAGYDAGRNKPDEQNCHFSLFGTPEMTRAWERGKLRGDREREGQREDSLQEKP